MGAAQSTAAADTRSLTNILVLATPLADEHRTKLEAAGFTHIEVVSDRTTTPTAEQLAQAHILYGFVQQAQLKTVAQVPNLRFIQLKSAGAESVVGLPLWKDEGASKIGLATASGVHTGPIPQYFIASTLILFHRLQQQVLLSQVEKRWGTNDDLGGGLFVQEFRGKTVGVLGYGHIGREAARLSAAFGANIIAANTSGTKKPQDGYIIPGTGDPDGSIPSAWYSTADKASLAKFLSQVDVVLLSLPSTPATHHILNAETIAHLKPTAIVVNVGRGDAIDTPALIAALDAEKIGGAALDVTEPEPLPQGHTLFGRPNVLITPHCSGRTVKYDELALDILLANVERWRKGESLLNAVDPQRGY